MALTYTYRDRKVVETTEERTIVAHDEWAMYTPKGNKRIQAIAQRFLNEVEKDGVGYSDKVNSAIKFLRTYRGMSQFKCYSGVGDTAVREVVWDFFEKVCDAIGIDGDSIWECPESGY